MRQRLELSYRDQESENDRIIVKARKFFSENTFRANMTRLLTEMLVMELEVLLTSFERIVEKDGEQH